MALQDLTPQLRTRLSRMERAVGWFVLLATLLLAFGFGYYIYKTAESKGWFIPKVNYQTSLNDATGLKPGDPVRLMGFNVGEITGVVPNDPADYYGVTICFNVRAPNFGYIWSDSNVKVSSDFLGNRFLEITKGVHGVPTVSETTNKVAVGILKLDLVKKELAALRQQGKRREEALALLNAEAATNQPAFYGPLAGAYWLEPQETPAISERLDRLVAQVEKALPNILALTNKIATVLANSANLTSNLDALAVQARPAAANLASLSAQLRGPGALGEWMLGSNGQRQIGATLDSANLTLATANATLTHTDTNLTLLVEDLVRSLDHLANITSNLDLQVQSNTNILGAISKSITDADDFVQGLKRHWLFRSAFRKELETNAPPRPGAAGPLRSPKDQDER